MPTDGTYAEFVKVPAANVHPKPSHLTIEEAAALPLAVVTAYRALVTRAALLAGEVAVITGIGGGVAQAALTIAVTLALAAWARGPLLHMRVGPPPSRASNPSALLRDLAVALAKAGTPTRAASGLDPRPQPQALMPPAPIADTISYEPSLAPEMSGMGANYNVRRG
jgi:hypothetical protein